MKVVLNRCFGGFSVSLAAARIMASAGHEQAAAEIAEYEAKEADVGLLDEHERKYGLRWYGQLAEDDRSNPALVEAVERLGEEANGQFAMLLITGSAGRCEVAHRGARRAGTRGRKSPDLVT
jgi:hypothetical protein